MSFNLPVPSVQFISTHKKSASARFASFAGAYDVVPSITAAYGMRRLRSAYTGSILRLRRSSDNAEQDIGYTGTGDLDTATIATFVGGGSGYIVNWYDQSGNGYTAAQTTAASQPLYVASGQNGKPVARFDGVDDWLSLSSGIAANADWTAFVVYKKFSAGDIFLGLCNSSGGGGPYTNAEWSDGNFYVSNHVNYWYVAGVFNTWKLAVSRLASGSASLWLDSILQSLTGPLSLISQTTFNSIGRRTATYLKGDMAELIICNAALSTGDRQAAEAASNAYWSIY